MKIVINGDVQVIGQEVVVKDVNFTVAKTNVRGIMINGASGFINKSGESYNFKLFSSIEVLNDDCLLSIFQYLPIKNRIGVERVCKRWQRISQESWRTVKKIDIVNELKTNSINVNHLKQILQRGGAYITYLDCSWLCKKSEISLASVEIIELINKYCTKLINLDVSDAWADVNCLGYLNVPLLKRLKILNIGNKKFCDQYLLEILRKAVNLEKFGVVGYHFIDEALLNLSGKCKTLAVKYSKSFSNQNLVEVLEKHPNIQNLDISGTKITPEALLPFLNQITCLSLWDMKNFIIYDKFKLLKLPNLKILDLNFNKWRVTGGILSLLAENCPALEDLRIQGVNLYLRSDYNHLTQLENLKYLDVSNSNISDADLTKIGTELRKLKKLFCYDCSQLNESGLKTIIATSPELTYLAITSSKITKTLVKSAVTSLQKRMNKNSLTISLRSDFVKYIPDRVKKLDLKNGINNCNRTNILRISYGANECQCSFDMHCHCSDSEGVLLSFD